jgi:pimeloyl-ACP methyl ester carboxylesterase
MYPVRRVTGVFRRAGAALPRVALVLAGLLAWGGDGAQAQSLQTFAPPSGKGPPLLVVSGQSGAANYTPMAKAFAARGYAVVLADGNDLFRAQNAGEAPFRAAVKAAGSAPAALPGPVGVVGFSLGGAAALAYGSRGGADIGAVVAVYPYTAWIEDPAAFVQRVDIRTLVLAATLDSWKDCCRIATARELARVAQAQKRPMRLVEYPGANHGFVLDGPAFRKGDMDDVLKRAAAHLGVPGKAKTP